MFLDSNKYLLSLESIGIQHLIYTCCSIDNIIQIVNSIIEPDQAENELKIDIRETQIKLMFTRTNKHVMIG